MSSIKKYLEEVIKELKKVSWPSKKQTIDKTILVVSVTIVVALYLGILDMIFLKIINLFITS